MAAKESAACPPRRHQGEDHGGREWGKPPSSVGLRQVGAEERQVEEEEADDDTGVRA